MSKNVYRISSQKSLLFVLLSIMTATTAFSGDKITYLEQGWTAEDRLRFYTTPQGSFLMPLAWYFALERPEGKKLFSSRKHISRFNYLFDKKRPAPTGEHKQNVLPIGFTEEPTPAGQTWLGMTCSACHTNDIRVKGKRLRIDGAPTLADFNGLIKNLHDAVKATLANKNRFARFARRVLKDPTSSDTSALYGKLNQYENVLGGFVERNIDSTGIHYGYARLDAFGAIMNEVFGDDLKHADNIKPANAPVSYPSLWTTPGHDWVQWNGSANNPLGRNVGEVLGVFGAVNLIDPDHLGKTTARGQELIELENLVAKLRAPKWPEKYLGDIDTEKAARGRSVYFAARQGEPSCAYCHPTRNSEGAYPLTPAEENKFGVQFIDTNMTPLPEIGTDPAMAVNFATRVVSTAHLGPVLPYPYTGASELPAPVLLSLLVGMATQNALAEIQPPLTEQERVSAIGYRIKADGLPPYAPANLLAYRAAPLDGIWASAPYLHNGSVLNLYELLLPAHERQTKFFVGSRQFDRKKVGFKNKKTKKSSMLDTTLAGNANSGHEYGVTLSKEDKKALIEFLKTL